MSKLTEIFKIENDKDRLKALLEYAKVLKIKTARTQQSSGEYSENELAVLIFNAEQMTRRNLFKRTAFLVAGTIVIGGILGAIFLLAVLMKG